MNGGKVNVTFRYFTGIRRRVFFQAILVGNWNKDGEYSEWWTQFPMEEILSHDGCPCFTTTLQLKNENPSHIFQWGVILSGPTGNQQWGIPTEVNELNSTACFRSFHLKNSKEPAQIEEYYLTHTRRLGARKYYPEIIEDILNPPLNLPLIQFSVWAPHAKTVELVFGKRSNGYIADDGSGINHEMKPIKMQKEQDGIWKTDPSDPFFEKYPNFHNLPYMYRITKEEGTIAYRTDLYAYEQIGKGDFDPKGKPYNGSPKELDGTKSCSLICDIERINPQFTSELKKYEELMPEAEFWENEFQVSNPMPQKLEDLIIYEMHIAALGAGDERPGRFEDAMILLPYLKELGVNAIELLPIMEFEGAANWGYGTSHFFAIESSAGGRDQLKMFIRECHRQGIAVIIDVVFNHYHHRAERAVLHYDSDNPAHDIYYWYEGTPNEYQDPEFGYIDNMSTGYAPRYHEEMVRKMFISSAIMLIEHFHVDGFRVDQTTSMHAYNVLHGNGTPMGNVNIYGAKFLRELTRTIKMIKPTTFLIAEDHSNWPKVVEPAMSGGLGFDATWYADFYHHLVGGQGYSDEYARILRNAGYGDDRELRLDTFASVLLHSRDRKVVYHESHDEAGNSQNSARTIEIAVNHAPLISPTKEYAYNRAKVIAAINLLSAGVPLFFMGEEVGARKEYTYFTFMQNREDLLRERSQDGSKIFLFYQDLIQLRLSNSAFRSHNLEIIHVHNQNRIIIFRRWDKRGDFLVVISLNNHSFADGYYITHPIFGDGLWREIMNSDAKIYNGTNMGNNSALIPAHWNQFRIIIPANSIIVFRKQM
jgi:1,4-alpha-glucan branching enzyme